MMFTEIVVPVEDPAALDGGGAWAALLGPTLGLDVRTLHVEAPAGAADSVEDAIVAQLGERSLLVMESEHADRWTGKASIAEHVVDRFGHTAIVIGPTCCGRAAGSVPEDAASEMPAGPILVAVDGSPRAEAALEVARWLGAALGRAVEVVRVAAVPIGRPDEAAALVTEAQRYVGGLHADASTVVSSNDPVSALADIAQRRAAGMVVLASRGDRQSPRPTIAKTCSGLVAASPCPVMVVGTLETEAS